MSVSVYGGGGQSAGGWSEGGVILEVGVCVCVLNYCSTVYMMKEGRSVDCFDSCLVSCGLEGQIEG